MKKFSFILIGTFVLFISCKNERKITKKDKIQDPQINIVFPDTVFINEYYSGRINYKNNLDTITITLDNAKKARFIEYGFLKTKVINYNDEYLKKIITDTFVTRNNRTIPLYNIKFNKLGLNYIDGIITDEVMIENGGKNAKGELMTRVITNEFRVTKKVLVINKSRLGK